MSRSNNTKKKPLSHVESVEAGLLPISTLRLEPGTGQEHLMPYELGKTLIEICEVVDGAGKMVVPESLKFQVRKEDGALVYSIYGKVVLRSEFYTGNS